MYGIILPHKSRFPAKTPDFDTSLDSHVCDTSVVSCGTDEGLEVSQRLAESIFAGPDIDADGEEILSGGSRRHAI